MPKINVLDFSIANLIAAGEVVDRPASVVKELLENSIDSGADMITVEIKNGGVSFIRVADNGCGMTAEDLPVAIKRHATSKIKDAKDLDAIFTLGFRGEALAAISSVSDVRILSRPKDQPLGNMLSSPAGKVPEITECGCSAGTSVIVENLFANVPARRKFLKKDSTEMMAVSGVVEKIALSHPEIAIKFISDGALRFATSGDGILLNSIYAVLGRDFASKLVEINGANDTIKISGYIGRPDNVRANRNFQNVFINGRYVKSKTVSAALEQAFTSYIQPERFPSCILFVEIAPSLVDVNVHPAKLEVKFANEKNVFETVYYSVRSALENKLSRPEIQMKEAAEKKMRETRTLHAFAPIAENRANSAPVQQNIQIAIESTGLFKRENFDKLKPSITVPKETFVPQREEYIPRAAEKPAEEVVITQPEVIEEEIPLPPEPPIMTSEPPKVTVIPEEEVPVLEPVIEPVAEPQVPAPEPYRIAGVLFNCYVIAEFSDRVIIIDKHAAHERIIFEMLKENTKLSHRSSQILFLPIEVTVSSEEYAALRDYSSELEKTGFAAKFAENNKVLICEVPVGIENDDVPDMIITVASKLSRGFSAVEEREAAYERALYQASCKAAVKAGRYDEPETVKWICDRVINDPKIRFCPHGRPVSMEMKKSDFDKQFSRM